MSKYIYLNTYEYGVRELQKKNDTGRERFQNSLFEKYRK